MSPATPWPWAWQARQVTSRAPTNPFCEENNLTVPMTMWLPVQLLRRTVTCVMLAIAIGVSVLSYPRDAMARERLPVRVLVITMFPAETSSWLQHESLPIKLHVPDLGTPIACARNGLCVAIIGEGKSNAVASMWALLDDPNLDFSNAYFLTAGIAGTSPSIGTLGFAAWARWIVDWDLGHHVPSVPHGYVPYDDQHTNVFHLNDKLVDKALMLTRGLRLSDSPEAVENRRHYAGQGVTKPFTTVCDTVSGDDYWAGTEFSNEAQYITDVWTKGAGEYCTSEMEDSGTATALDRHGYLNRYLDLRTASDFDQPFPGQRVQDLLSKFPGFDIAVKNAYLVGSTVAHFLIENRHLDVEGK
jgi:purine nucleoside permease